MPSTSHQFCTPWLQLTPSTWHAGCRILQRPFRWLAEEQSRLWNRLLRASAIGPDDLLAVGAKDQAVGRLRPTSRERGSITAFLGRYSARNPDYPQSIFKSSSAPSPSPTRCEAAAASNMHARGLVNLGARVISTPPPSRSHAALPFSAAFPAA